MDNDCDTLTDGDDDDAQSARYADADADGYGAGALDVAEGCTDSPGWSSNADDCDDTDAAIHLNQPEVCDDQVQDCDEQIDEDPAEGPVWYADQDGDDLGDPTDGEIACDQPPARVADDSNRDDGDMDINPEATEVCDSLDNDCDGAIDDADDSTDPSSKTTWYYDGDSDGDGTNDVDLQDPLLACTPPSEHRASKTEDCDDDDPRVPDPDGCD